MRKTTHCVLALLAFWFVWEGSVTAHCAEPPPVITVWNKLGIPQGIHKIMDAHINKFGLHPGCERKPPLKRIADPANLAPEQPQIIQVAAKVKMDRDMKQQKIKAIRYLADTCCACPKDAEDVKNALLSALDDCTPEVRKAAAVAFSQCAGNPCVFCNPASCCDKMVIKKLEEMAFGTDKQGCPLEPDPRVRAAAARAMNACQGVTDVEEPTVVEPPVIEPDVELREPSAGIPGGMPGGLTRREFELREPSAGTPDVMPGALARREFGLRDPSAGTPDAIPGGLVQRKLEFRSGVIHPWRVVVEE